MFKPKKEWYAEGLRFTCTQCGNCCTGGPGYVWFNDQEAQAMAQYAGLSDAAFRRRHAHTVNGHWTLNERIMPNGDHDCVFLTHNADGTRGCSIYPVRPQQCRTWPFWRENLRSESDWQHASRKCPGMQAGNTGRGDFYSVEQIRIIRDSNNP